ncbi:MAG: DUF72 domain-containing protein [Ectothiorhodospiraceae bacterium]|nr:DUF72 domain-containing protein [Ectothiorhodospiraceae bacterium]
MQEPKAHIGTSGWFYRHWMDAFYPQGLPAERMLEYYGKRFGATEINSSFYRLPEPDTLEHWRTAVPTDFVFAAKASRYITHMKKLREPRNTVPPLLKRMEILGSRLGPILFQLPPRWSANPKRLQAFLSQLSKDFRYAMELRDPSWWCADVLDTLTRHSVAFCIHDLDGTVSPLEVTADFVYVRLHGPGDAYRGRYTHKALARWRDACHGWLDSGKAVYCFFDNDECGNAAINADELQNMLGISVTSPVPGSHHGPGPRA